MARRSVTGQLNIFDLYDVPMGDVEMVSLMPSEETEPDVKLEQEKKVTISEIVVEETPKVKDESVVKGEAEVEEEKAIEETVEVKKETERVAMSRTYEKNGEKIEIAYINYNTVRITIGDKEPVRKVFSSSKEAVDFYVEEMQALEE